jgi:hypothetical protein
MSGSDLQAYAAHCRHMSTAEHRLDCPGRACGPAAALWGGLDWLELSPPPCPGCVTPEDRARWVMLADEAEAYLRREPEPTLL